MPQYDYQCVCGETISRICPMAERKVRVKCPACGKLASRSFKNFPAIHCRYSYMDKVNGNPRVTRGKG